MKIIRDKLAGRITDAPVRAITDNSLFRELLLEKLIEELGELADSNYKDVFEYADVIEVVLAIAYQNAISVTQINNARMEKLDKNGGFKEGWILEASEAELKAQKLKEQVGEKLLKK